MIDVARIVLGNGQSYEKVSILTAVEVAVSVRPIFGDSTFAFIQHTRQDNKFITCHVSNVLGIHLTKLLAPVLNESIPFERVVLAHDAVYGPGQFYLPSQHTLFGLEPFVLSELDFVPFLFSTVNQGLFLVNDKKIASLECKAAYDIMASKQFMPHKLGKMQSV